MFRGRIGRLQYLTRYIVLSLIWFAALCFTSTDDSLLRVVNWLYTVGLLVIAIERCHDVSVKGWGVLIFVIPFVNVIFGFYLLLKRGTAGENKWGPEPPARIAIWSRLKEPARA